MDGSDVSETAQPGRVVRLHFQCHAEIPIGSFLRVTGSTLWAPGTSASDPTDSLHVAQQFATEENPGAASSLGSHTALNVTASNAFMTPPSAGTMYASSVEMVTTPEDYPIWKTRKPVIVVLNSNRNRNRTVQHHYYRYLVVSPGSAATIQTTPPVQHFLHAGGVPGHVAPLAAEDDADDAMLVSTSNEVSGSTMVMQWEDPFRTLGAQHGTSTSSNQIRPNSGGGKKSQADPVMASQLSAISLSSGVTASLSYTPHVTSMDYRNLPYRTLDINALTGRPMYEDVDDNDKTGVRLDRWGIQEDASFQPYLIREAINAENRRKLNRGVSEMTDVDSMDTSGESKQFDPEQRAASTDSGHTTPPVFGSNNRLFFVCFHLPVVVVKNQSTGEWEATWSESILAKTEGSEIVATYDAHWVGTVTTHPPLQTENEKDQVRSLLAKMNCTPVFLDASVRQAHYFGFCKQVLWPAFHNIDLLDMSTSGWLYTNAAERQNKPDDGSGVTSSQSEWDQSRLEDWRKAYEVANQQFADLMSQMLRAGDICWIHDYHLALLPQQLSAWEVQTFGIKVTRKVFFLHIPFPTSQIFRELECGEQILQGMLHADVVGFHAFDHARHFLNAAKRILGLNYETIAGGLIGVNFQGATVLVSMSNVSIEPRKVDTVLALPTVAAGAEDLRRRHGGRIVIGALDIGQRLSGASLKLLAYERLLQDYPAWQHRVVMVQRLLIPGSRRSDEALTVRELRSLVKRIQEKFGAEVIDYQEVIGSTLPMDQRLALWKGSDILISTPIREGLNHWPMEFIYAHKEPDTPGVVIASEFSAISSILNGALRVNPYDIQATVATIDKALSMDIHEREGRRYRDIDFVSSSPSDKWVKNVLRDLRDATAWRHSNTSASETASTVSTPYATPSRYRKSTIDSTATFLARETEQAFAHLSMKGVSMAYHACKRRVLVLDFNGTIVLKEPPGKYLKREILGTSGNKPPPEVLAALSKLSQDPKNLIYVVSGDSSENVLSALGTLTGIGLGVSNGARFSPPLEKHTDRGVGIYTAATNQRRWLTFDLGVDWEAVKRVALPVLSKYTARSNGSFVKLTTLSIGWSYYSCDPEWGALQAAHLVLELESELRAFDVRFVTLKGIVEIVPQKLNKGLIVKKILRDCDAEDPNNPVDFTLCFGDDISDERMFTSVFTFLAEQGDRSNHSPIPTVVNEDSCPHTIAPSSSMLPESDCKSLIPTLQYAFTVAVGKKASHASFFVNDAQEVANCLVMLAKGETPDDSASVWGCTNSSNRFS